MASVTVCGTDRPQLEEAPESVVTDPKSRAVHDGRLGAATYMRGPLSLISLQLEIVVGQRIVPTGRLGIMRDLGAPSHGAP